ncbi:MAG: T9SS type A sorting domain-containing protein [Bacteroidetes bacterium]|nr:T9SS type A sorting domain-containing protein [Bacteroidota bacterium]
MAAYPNPFQAATTLEFSVPTTQSVSLKLFSLTGVEIASLFEGNAEGGVVHSQACLAAGVLLCLGNALRRPNLSQIAAAGLRFECMQFNSWASRYISGRPFFLAKAVALPVNEVAEIP